jgi:hypothetical protein
MRAVTLLLLVNLPLIAPAFALDDAVRAEAVDVLKENVENALTRGEQLAVYADILGQRKNHPVASVDTHAITLKVGANLFPLRWSTLKAEDLAGLARSVAGDNGERLVVASEVALLLGFPDRANEWLGLIRDPNEALALKIRNVISSIAEARAATPPPAPANKTPAPTPETSKPPATASPAITGPALNVGPTRALKTIASALAKAKAGTTVLVDPGTYAEAFKMRNQGQPGAPVTLRGLKGPNGERPVLDATGVSLSGVGPTPRAIIQIEGTCCVVEGLELKNARNGNNGAGIRFLNCTNAVVRDCKITYCDMGLMGGDLQTALVERCEVASNGTKDFDGYSHNFYLLGNRTTIRECYVHDALFGQNFKTRGRYTELWYNVICDSEEGELGFVDGDDSALPNAHTLMVGNVIVSKPERRGNASKFIDFGGEGKARNGSLFLFHNTLVAGTPRIQFLRLVETTNDLVASNNLFVGSSKPAELAGGKASGTRNFSTGGLPAALTNSIKGNQPGFVNTATRDFHLQPGSPCVNAGAPEDTLTYMDADGKSQKIVVERQIVTPLTTAPRAKKAAPDVGAFGTP